jgi:hypothetical protein
MPRRFRLVWLEGNAQTERFPGGVEKVLPVVEKVLPVNEHHSALDRRL